MKSIGMARLGRDAEIRYTPDGTAVANLSLAVTYGRKGQDGKYPTQWVDAALFGKQAEALAPYLFKGCNHCFTLDGMHIETFTKTDGTQSTKLSARVIDVELGPRVDALAQAPAPRPPAQRPAARPAPAPAAGGSGFDDMDDDVPF